MNTEDLEIFVEVANAGGVSPAARRLGLSKSVVSRRLARLEAELGVQLIARTTRGAALTEAGVRFREHAERITGQVEAAQDSVRPEGDLRGRFRVALPVTFGPTLFAPILTQMAAENPRLHVQASYSDRFIDLVGEGFDCAVRVGYLADSSLVARRVGVIHGRLVASPAYLARHGALETLEQLLDHDMLMQGTEAWQFMDGDDVVTVQPQGRFKADNAEALVVAVLAGVGIWMFPAPDHAVTLVKLGASLGMIGFGAVLLAALGARQEMARVEVDTQRDEIRTYDRELRGQVYLTGRYRMSEFAEIRLNNRTFFARDTAGQLVVTVPVRGRRQEQALRRALALA